MDEKNTEKNNEKTNEKTNKKSKKKKKEKWYVWGFIVLGLSFVLTILFSFLTDISISNSTAAVCIIVMLVLLILNISSDIFANAVLSCSVEPFLSMAARKLKGAKRAVALCKNAHKVGSIFADVIGDICGIVSGAAGATLTAILIAGNSAVPEIIVSVLVSAVVGALTVGGKAFFKVFAVKYSNEIVYGVSRVSAYLIKEK